MKILIARFSSIGDIVLTTPVIRGLKEQLDDVEVHYLTKTGFKSIVEDNPRVDKVFTIEKSVDEVILELKKEQYDWIIDLHNNIRTKSLKSKLQKSSKTVRKLNLKKWLLVKLKMNRMPKLHIVDRYMETVLHLGIRNDSKECEFYINSKNAVDVESLGVTPGKYLTVAIGAQFSTKRLPELKLIEILKQVEGQIVLVGGPTDQETGDKIVAAIGDRCINSCGSFNLQQSASIVEQSSHLLTHDTGMMHIASCFKVPMTTVWGNTVPDLGMYAYLPSKSSIATVHQVENLSCRPCSKIGYQKCPKGHFRCMEDQNIDGIVADLSKNK